MIIHARDHGEEPSRDGVIPEGYRHGLDLRHWPDCTLPNQASGREKIHRTEVCKGIWVSRNKKPRPGSSHITIVDLQLHVATNVPNYLPT